MAKIIPLAQQILTNEPLTIMGLQFTFLSNNELRKCFDITEEQGIEGSKESRLSKLKDFLNILQPMLDEYCQQLGKKPLLTFLSEKFQNAIFNLLKANDIDDNEARTWAEKESKSLIKALELCSLKELPKYCQEEDNYYFWTRYLDLYKDLKKQNIIQQALTIEPLTVMGLEIPHPTADELKIYKKICIKWAKLDDDGLANIDPNEREVFNKTNRKIRALFLILENLVSKIYCEERIDAETGEKILVPAVGYDSDDIPDLLAENYRKAIENSLKAKGIDDNKHHALIDQECSIPHKAIEMFLSLEDWPRSYKENEKLDLLVKNLALFDRRALKNKTEEEYFHNHPNALSELKDLIHDYDWDRLVDQHGYIQVLDKLQPYLVNIPYLTQSQVHEEAQPQHKEPFFSGTEFEQRYSKTTIETPKNPFQIIITPPGSKIGVNSYDVLQAEELNQLPITPKTRVDESSYDELQYEEDIVRPLDNPDIVPLVETAAAAQSERLNALPQILKPKTRLEEKAKKYLTHHIEKNNEHFHVLIHDACLMPSANEAKTTAEKKKNNNKKAAFNFIFKNNALFRQLLNITEANIDKDTMLANLENSLLMKALYLYNSSYQIPEGAPNPYEENFSAYPVDHAAETFIKSDHIYSARSFVEADGRKMEIIAKHALAKEMLKPYSRKLCYENICYIPKEIRRSDKLRSQYLQGILHLAQYDEYIISDLLDRRFAFSLISNKANTYLSTSDIVQLLKFGCNKNKENGILEYNKEQIIRVFSRRFFNLIPPDAKNFSGKELVELLMAANSSQLRRFIQGDKHYLKAINNYILNISEQEKANILDIINATQGNKALIEELTDQTANSKELMCLHQACENYIKGRYNEQLSSTKIQQDLFTTPLKSSQADNPSPIISSAGNRRRSKSSITRITTLQALGKKILSPQSISPLAYATKDKMQQKQRTSNGISAIQIDPMLRNPKTIQSPSLSTSSPSISTQGSHSPSISSRNSIHDSEAISYTSPPMSRRYSLASNIAPTVTQLDTTTTVEHSHKTEDASPPITPSSLHTPEDNPYTDQTEDASPPITPSSLHTPEVNPCTDQTEDASPPITPSSPHTPEGNSYTGQPELISSKQNVLVHGANAQDPVCLSRVATPQPQQETLIATVVQRLEARRRHIVNSPETPEKEEEQPNSKPSNYEALSKASAQFGAGYAANARDTGEQQKNNIQAKKATIASTSEPTRHAEDNDVSETKQKNENMPGGAPTTNMDALLEQIRMVGKQKQNFLKSAADAASNSKSGSNQAKTTLTGIHARMFPSNQNQPRPSQPSTVAPANNNSKISHTIADSSKMHTGKRRSSVGSTSSGWTNPDEPKYSTNPSTIINYRK